MGKFRPSALAASLAVAGVLLLAGCGASEPAAGSTAEPWGKLPNDTTCDDWLQTMDRAQRAEMARWLLDALGGDRAALAAEVARFELAIGDYCRSPRENQRAAFGEIVDSITGAAAFSYEQVTGEPLRSL
jgi:glycerol-3-phosphate O-acyltransferase